MRVPVPKRVRERRPLGDRHHHPASALDGRRAALWAAGVSSYVVLSWLLVQRALPHWSSANPSLNYYLIQPVVWLTLAAVALAGWRRLPERPRFSRVLTGIAALLGAVHVGLLVFGGVIGGFGTSAAAGQIANYPRNLWFFGTWLLGLEMARAFVFHAWRSWSNRGAFAMTTALLTLAMTPYGRMRALADGDTFAEILGGFLIPLVLLNILLTWLVDHGGPGPAIAYRFILLAFEWFSQVQPDLDWPALFVVGSVAPIISARFIRRLYLDTEEGSARWSVDEEDGDGERTEKTGRAALVWSLSLVVVLVLGGALGFRPAVVNGTSMEPAYERGDMAIIQRDVDPATLQVGDVVEFQDLSGRSVIHRVIAIDDGSVGLMFTTKGDSNPRPDGSFSAENIKGKVVFLLPGLGWPSLWLRGA